MQQGLRIAEAATKGRYELLDKLIADYWEDTVKRLKPSVYGKNSNDDEERKANVSFSSLCHLLGEHTNKDPKQMTAFEFYSLLDYVSSKLDKR